MAKYVLRWERKCSDGGMDLALEKVQFEKDGSLDGLQCLRPTNTAASDEILFWAIPFTSGDIAYHRYYEKRQSTRCICVW